MAACDDGDADNEQQQWRQQWRFREIYDRSGGGESHSGAPDTLLLPELVTLGYDRFPAARRSGLDTHRHPDAFEICFFLDGRVHWQADGTVYGAGRGDLFVTLPDELHGGVDAVMEPCAIYWTQVRFAGAERAFPALTAAEAAALEQGLRRAAARRAFPAAEPEMVAAAFSDLLTEHRRGATPLGAVAARAALHRLLVQVIRDAAATPAPLGEARADDDAPRDISPSIARALAWMQARLGEPFFVEAAARAAGLSAGTFHERFVREVGLTPAEWRVRQRIETAKVWLVRDPEASVTDIALALGFGSSQYFATAFKRYTARTPSEYRRRLLRRTDIAEERTP